MLRITVEIVPYGIETQSRPVGRLEISNVGTIDVLSDGDKVCVYQPKETSPAEEEWPRVEHARGDGFWVLIGKAIQRRFAGEDFSEWSD